MVIEKVSEYTISVVQDEGGFNVVHTILKTDDGKIIGPLEFVPAYAHRFSDELCIASARAAKKSSGASESVSDTDPAPPKDRITEDDVDESTTG